MNTKTGDTMSSNKISEDQHSVAIPTIRGHGASTIQAGVTAGHRMPASVDEANADFEKRRTSLISAWAENFRYAHNGVFPPWQNDDQNGKDGTTAMRQIAAGMAIFADETEAFNGNHWALFSGHAVTESKAIHQTEFVGMVERYINQQIKAYKDIGTDGIPGKTGGDYDFVLRDIVALIHVFIDRPDILTNCMIRKLICQDKVTFSGSHGDCSASDGPCTATGRVPFSGTDLDEWLAAGPDGRYFFRFGLPDVDFPASLVVPDGAVEFSTPETENHLLGIYAWRFLVNEYLTFVADLKPGDKRYYRFDPCLKSLVDADPGRYRNDHSMVDFVLQLLGRIPHSGLFESNAKPYEAFAIGPILAFYQASGLLFSSDPGRQKIKIAAHNALDYLAAEFAFQSFEGKRMAPFRRNYEHIKDLAFYQSDYIPHVFGVLTGAYVFPDDETGSFHWARIDQEGGFAIWALLSGYRVPRGIHDFMLNKHGGYFARIQTRYSKNAYPLNFTVDPGGILDRNPEFARPRYFQAVSSGEVSLENYDLVGAGDFTPVTQLYFATRDYLNSGGGHNLPYYGEVKLPRSLIERLIIGIVLPFIPGILALIAKQLNELINNLPFVRKLRGSDVNSRPSVLITRGNLPIRDGASIEALEQVIPAMRGQDDYWASRNLTTYKSFSLGYTFNPDDERHLDWPQRYPQAWNDFRVELFGTGRASVHIFNFTAQPDHPLAGYYWVLGQFSKSANKGQFRNYGRGFWEVVPGHQFPSASALAEHIRQTNPPSHFDNDEDHHYTYQLASTGERVVIHNLFGSTATDQAILEIRMQDGTQIPLNMYTADLRDSAGLRQIPLLDAWQVDRDYGFTGSRYAHANGHGRVVIHNLFVGETLTLDSSDYRLPMRSLDPTGGRFSRNLPILPGSAGATTSIVGVTLSNNVVYATHYVDGTSSQVVTAKFPEDSTASQQSDVPPGELVALDSETLNVLGRVTVGCRPRAVGLHHASKRIYVMNRSDVSVSVIDGNNYTPVQTISFQGFAPIEMAVSQKYHRVYITQPGQKRILILDGNTLDQLAPMTDLELNGDVVIDEPTDKLYTLTTSDLNPFRLDLIEFEITATGQHELRRTTVDGNVSKHAKMAVDAERLYVINNGRTGPDNGTGQQLTVLNRADLTIQGHVPLQTGAGNAVAASASQNVAYVVATNDLKVIDTITLQIIHTVPTASSSTHAGIAVDERTGRAWYGATNSSTLYGPPTATFSF